MGDSRTLIIGSHRAARRYAAEHDLSPHDCVLIGREEVLLGFSGPIRVVALHDASYPLCELAEERGLQVEFV